MPKTLIEQLPIYKRSVAGADKLAISELFCDTIQGEGVNAGCTATFLRLQGCTLDCVFCDTAAVWREGNEYSFDEIFQLFEENDLIFKFKKEGQHLILTGGSPLKQQERLIAFLENFTIQYGFTPYIEVENETVLMPDHRLTDFVSCWNNSPKLANSGMKERARYKTEVIHTTAQLKNSWFKFVVTKEEDWTEIFQSFILPGLVDLSQVILMPEGQTQAELEKSRPMAAELAAQHGVRFSDRMHITIWDKKTGV